MGRTTEGQTEPGRLTFYDTSSYTCDNLSYPDRPNRPAR